MGRIEEGNMALDMLKDMAWEEIKRYIDIKFDDVNTDNLNQSCFTLGSIKDLMSIITHYLQLEKQKKYEYDIAKDIASCKDVE